MGTFLEDLVCLLLRYAFDLLEVPPRRVCHRLDGVVAAIYDELDVTLGETTETLHGGTLLATGSWECALAVKTRLESCQRRGRTGASHALITGLHLIVVLLCLCHFRDGVGGRCLRIRNRKTQAKRKICSHKLGLGSSAYFVSTEVTLVAKL